jgi:signal peptidase
VRRGTVVALAVLAVVVAPPPSPVQLSYATSDSMAPTIGAGDGFLVVATGDPEVGDVVTFYSPERDELVTHRVVGQTEAGLLTKGDANPSTDQAAGLAPVTGERVLGTVPAVGGSLLVLPGLGAVVEPVKANPMLVALALAAVALALVARSGPARPTQRSVPQVDDLVVPVLVVAAVGSLAFTLFLGASVYEFQYVAVDGPPTTEGEVSTTDPTTRIFTVRGVGTPLHTVLVDTDGLAVADRQVSTEEVRLRATPTPPDGQAGGTFDVTVRAYAYPSTLPEGLLRTLHDVHPVLAAVSSVGAAFVPLYGLYLLLFDGRTPLRPPRRRWLRRLLGGSS